MLKFKTTHGTQAAAPSETADRKCSFVHSQTGHSNAVVVFRNVSIPLAWPADEYFGYRKEFRSFTVQILWRTSDGRELFSRPLENVDRTFTDVNFSEEFRFENQPPDFCIEAIVYCRRTDEDAGVSVVQALSRSLGRSLGTSLKKYMQSTNTISAAHLGREVNGNARTNFSPDYIENYRNPEKMCALGSARFRLRNATLSGRVHSYNLETLPHGTYPGIAKSQLLPIYGMMCAQVLVQPTSLGSPLGQGTMDIFFSDGGILLNNLHCVLQGGYIKCYRSEEMLQHGVQPSMSLPLNEMTKTEPSVFQTAIRLRLVDPESMATKSAMLIASSHSSFLGWKSAINLQIMDCVMWNDFANASRNPHAAKLSIRSSSRTPRIPTKYYPSSTLSAANGKPIVSSLQANASPTVVRRETTTEGTLPKRNIHETAAATGRKSRMPLKGVFEASEDHGYISEEPKPEHPPEPRPDYEGSQRVEMPVVRISPPAARSTDRARMLPRPSENGISPPTARSNERVGLLPERSENVPANTYVISLKIGLDEDDLNRYVTGSMSGNKSSGSSDATSSGTNTISSSTTSTASSSSGLRSARYQHWPQERPRPSEASSVELSRRQKDDYPTNRGQATVSRAETWHYAFKSDNVTKL